MYGGKKNEGIFGKCNPKKSNPFTPDTENSKEETKLASSKQNPFTAKSSSIFGGNSKSPSTIHGKGSSGFGLASRDDHDIEMEEDKKNKIVRSFNKSKKSDDALKMDKDLEISIIKTLSELRCRQLEDLKKINSRKFNEVNIKKIGIYNNDESSTQIEVIKRPNFQKDLLELNYKALADFRDVLQKHHHQVGTDFPNSDEKDKYLLSEISLISLVMFSFHFVENYYVPYLMKDAIMTFQSPEEEDSEEEPITSKVYDLIKSLDFEKAYDLLTTAEERSDIFEEVSKIIYPIKNYFSQGFSRVYQSYEISQIFDSMVDQARKLYTGL